MTAPPGWAANLDARQYQRFHRLVDSFLRQRGVERSADQRGVYDDQVLTPVLEVHTLAEACRQLPEPDWPVHIARTLGGVVAARAANHRAAALNDYAVARELLRVELWPAATLDASLSLRPWLAGLSQGLALQLEGAAVSVSQQELESWDVAADEAFTQALRNVKRGGMLTPRTHPLKTAEGECGEVALLIDGPRFMAAHAMFISAYASEAIDKGVLFVVPHDRLVVMHAIGSAAALHAAIRQLAAFAYRANTTAPRALSTELYWWHEGRFYHLPIEHTDGTMVFTPPDEFVDAVLNPLDALTPS